jgi:hypothetical protein
MFMSLVGRRRVISASSARCGLYPDTTPRLAACSIAESMTSGTDQATADGLRRLRERLHFSAGGVTIMVGKRQKAVPGKGRPL